MAVNVLGMEEKAMTLYEHRREWENNANRITEYVLSVGNFGQNRDSSNFREKPYIIRKAISLGYRYMDWKQQLLIFPWDATKVWADTHTKGMFYAMLGKG